LYAFLCSPAEQLLPFFVPPVEIVITPAGVTGDHFGGSIFGYDTVLLRIY